jgi:hypothetical protein
VGLSHCHRHVPQCTRTKPVEVSATTVGCPQITQATATGCGNLISHLPGIARDTTCREASGHRLRNNDVGVFPQLTGVQRGLHGETVTLCHTRTLMTGAQ